MAAEQKQRDVSQNMSPKKEVMVQTMKGMTKKTRVIHSVGKVTHG